MLRPSPESSLSLKTYLRVKGLLPVGEYSWYTLAEEDILSNSKRFTLVGPLERVIHGVIKILESR